MPSPTESRAKQLLSAPAYKAARGALTTASVGAILALSMPRFRGNALLLTAEVGIAAFFTLDYVLSVLAARTDPTCGYSRRGYVFSVGGLVAFAAMAPFWAEKGLWLAGRKPMKLEVFLLARVLRSFRFDAGVKSLEKLTRVFAKTKDKTQSCSFASSFRKCSSCAVLKCMTPLWSRRPLS